MHKLGLQPPSKVITFSAHDQNADLYLDRGLIISRLANWPARCWTPTYAAPGAAQRGKPHGRAGRRTRLACAVGNHGGHTQSGAPGPAPLSTRGREPNGVQFINDSKATNVDALRSALLAARPGDGGEPNVLLIAGRQG